MTDRLKRETELPSGYQFGDARPEPVSPEGATLMINGIEYIVGAPIVFDRSKPVGQRFCWNTIEGDHHPLDEQ